jgi:glycosyltransferase involved in cell wall biosynthesis
VHVCFLTYGPWPGNPGLTRPTLLGAALAERGVEVSYLVDDLPANHGDLGLHADARIAWVPRSRGAAQVATRRRALARVAPSHVHVLNPHAKALATLGGMRHVDVVADWDEPPVLRPFGRVRLALERGLDAWLRRRGDHHVACTHWLQDEYLDGIPSAYIPHGTFLGAFEPTPSPFDEPTAVYLGSFFPKWDHDVVFHAARRLAERGLGPPIVFVGDGQDRARWEAFVTEHELTNVSFAGWLDDDELKRHLAHAHVALFPIRDSVLNRARCPSKTLAYAQASRPVITCRVGEVPEILGEAATYVDCTPEAFADAIAEAMARTDLPHVDFHPERHSYADRAERYLELLARPSVRARRT